jgi:hypothetical protein
VSKRDLTQAQRNALDKGRAKWNKKQKRMKEKTGKKPYYTKKKPL